MVIDDPFERSWGDRTYAHVALLNHGGRVIAVAQDAAGGVCYSVLDPEEGESDADGWSDQPLPLPFPSELELIGFGAVDPIALPKVRRGAGVATDADATRLSTTARLTDAAGPVQLLSDGRLVYVFRQSADGTALLDTEGRPLPVTAGTLLLDRYLLVGSELQSVCEVRYQRSRSKTTPADGRDGLGARDLDGHLFVEPTQVVGFVTGLVGNDVAPLLLPTAVAGVERWLLVRRDKARNRLDLVGCARTPDGLFDTRGSRGWRCPDHADGFALEPGACTLPSVVSADAPCGRQRLPVPPEEVWAGSAVVVGGDAWLDLAVDAPRVVELTAELWVKPVAATGTTVRPLIGPYPDHGVLSVVLGPDGALTATAGGLSVSSLAGVVAADRWQHVAVVRESGGLRLFRDGVLVAAGSAAPGDVPGSGSRQGVFLPDEVGRSKDGPIGPVDDVRLWDRPRSGQEIREQMRSRLTGLEPGLVHYWRMDEAGGASVRDLAGTSDGTIQGAAPQWVPSEAPIALAPGLTRSSVALDGLTLTAAPAAVCYHQQARMKGGYARTEQPVKTAPRVMIAVPGSTPDGAGTCAVLDLGVHVDGGPAEAPALLTLPVVGADPVVSAGANATNLAVAQAVLADPKAATAGATEPVLSLCRAYATSQQALDDHRATWTRNWASFDTGVTTFYENSARDDGAGPRTRLEVVGAASEGNAGLRADGSWTDRVTAVRPAPFALVTVWDDDQFRGRSSTVRADREVDLESNDTVTSWKIERDPAQVQADADGLRAKQAARDQAHTALAAVLSTLLPTEDGRPTRLTLPLVALDAQGATVVGARSAMLPVGGRPVLVESALGRVLLYGRDADGRLRSAHFDARVGAATGLLAVADGQALTLAVRRPELLADATSRISATVERTAGATPTVGVTVTRFAGGQPAQTERWTGLQPTAAAVAAAINTGVAGGAAVAAQPASRLVVAAADGGSGDSGATDTVSLLPGALSTVPGFQLTPRGRALSLTGQGGYLSGPADPLARTGDLSVEAWVRAEPVAHGDPQIVVRHSQGKVGYALALLCVADASAPGGRATRLQGIVGGQTRTAKVGYPPGGWRHLALTYQQRYGVVLDGETGCLRLGDSPALALTGDLTLEVELTLAVGTQDQILLGRGDPTDPTQGLPYLLWVTADRHPAFAYRDGDGSLRIFRSGLTVPADGHHRVSVSRKAGTTTPTTPTSTQTGTDTATVHNATAEALVTVTFRVDDGTEEQQDLRNGSGVRSSDHVTWLGRPWRGGAAVDGLPAMVAPRATVTRVRLWAEARKAGLLGRPSAQGAGGLLGDWTFPEGSGPSTADDVSRQACALDGGVTWRPTPDPTASPLRLFVDGLPVATELWREPPVVDDQFTVGAQQVQAPMPLAGWVEELRVWKSTRTQEQLQDNMFRPLDAELDDLLGYWRFDTDGSGPSQVPDSGPGGLSLTRTGDVAVLPSTAPVADEGPQILEAGRSLATRWTATGDDAAAAAEYADLQDDARGRPLGVFKRCYGYVAAGRLHLVTGYKVGDTTLEWVGQVQTDPQLIGYVEGAPPVPGDNFATGTDYSGASSVKLSLAESSTYTSGNSLDLGFSTAIEAKAQVGFKNEVEAGVAVTSKVSEYDVAVGAQTSFSLRNGHIEESESGRGREQEQVSELVLAGRHREGRLYEPANAGFALVRSSTADKFALRLKATGALVGYSTRASADIPPDWNVITFRLDPRYTKQGTLDGRRGLAADPDFPQSGARTSDLSYFKPVEAYELKRRITQQDQLLLARYEQANARKDERIDLRDVRRSLVNTYVWTAEGGLFAEETQSVDSMTTSDSGTYSWELAGGIAVDAAVYGGTVGGKGELSALFGGYRDTTTTKTRESETTYGLEVSLEDVERDLGDPDARGRTPGKVDAYRFMTFYLDPHADHFDLFFNRVVDPAWLQGDTPSAAALREARQTLQRPRCWRVLHRVTYVSRILPEPDGRPGVDAVAEAMSACDLTSNYELVRALEPYLRHRTGSRPTFLAAVRSAVQSHLPRLLPHVEEVGRWLGDYFGVPTADGTAVDPADDAEPLAVAVQAPATVPLNLTQTLTASVLSETVSLTPASYRLRWSSEDLSTSGVWFDNPDQLQTTARFAVPGRHVVRLSATPLADGIAPGYAEAVVTVLPA